MGTFQMSFDTRIFFGPLPCQIMTQFAADTQGAWFRIMDVRALVDGAGNLWRVNLSVRTGQEQDFAAVGKELRRATLGSLDVRRLVAQETVI